MPIPIKNPNISTNRYKELLRIEKYYKKYQDKYYKEFKENQQLKENYEKAIEILDGAYFLPCEYFADFDEKYCEERCGEGYKSCWKHYIENCYKGENNE